MSWKKNVASNLRAAAKQMAGIAPLPVELDAATRRLAEAAVKGVCIVHYMGDQHLEIGRRNTDWKLDGRHIELRAFVYGTPFIRHLGVAYHLTRDERYAEAARDYLREYMAAYPIDRIGQDEEIDSTLALAGRVTTWATMLHILVDSKAFDEAFVVSVIEHASAQLDFLQRNMKPVINWRVFEARALLTSSLYLQFAEHGPQWKRYAVRVLNDAFHRQFLPDGVHCERVPTYHMAMADTFRDVMRYGKHMPELGLRMTAERLSPMYDFDLACTKPNGYLCGIHDSQTEFTGHLRDGKHTAGHRSMDGKAAWQRFRDEFGMSRDLPATTQVYPHAAFAFMRTDWDEDATWMSFDATNWGSGHDHLSRNAIQLHAHRQSMVIDPGWLDYASNKWGMYGRSTRAHATCNLNGMNQSSTNPRTFQHSGTPGYDCVFSVYDGGYWDTECRWNFTHAGKGIWAEHGRILFRVGDRFAFVADSMFRLPQVAGDPAGDKPAYECVWPLAPGASVKVDESTHRAAAQWTDAGLLMLVPIRPAGSQFEVHEGEEDPVRGWVPGDGQHHPAPQVVLNTPVMEQQHEYYVTVLIPYKGDTPPAVKVESKSPMGQAGFVRLTWADGSEDTVYWSCNFNMMLGQWPDFETDASLVHVRKDANGKVQGGCCVGGTYIEPFDPQTRAEPGTFVF